MKPSLQTDLDVSVMFVVWVYLAIYFSFCCLSWVPDMVEKHEVCCCCCCNF